MAKPAKRKAAAKASLPKHAPKRTGKKGIGPAPDKSDDLPELDSVGRPIEQEQLETPDTPKRKPRQPRLPTMQDPEIEELETAAEAYADVRDQRMELTLQEVQLKEELLKLMESHGKTSYVHDGYDIKVVMEAKKVKVKIKKDD
jgi:hypothetical protein